MSTQDLSSIPGVAGNLVWSFGAVEFDERRWQLRVRGAAVELEPRPLEILACLLRHAGETVSREELLQDVWGHAHLSKNALSNSVGKLRRAIDDEDETLIVTVHRIGYRLAAPVSCRVAYNEPVALGLATGSEVPARPGWRLQRQLGLPPSPEVWLAQCGDQQRVFKFSADGSRLPSLRREAAVWRVLASALERPETVARVIDWNFDTAPYFIECEYGGESLVEWAGRPPGLSALALDDRIEVAARIADAVAAAHRVGVLHKDLKPANILAAAGPDRLPALRLTDFGAADLDERSTTALESMSQTLLGALAGISDSGTPMYLAPELLRGEPATVQSDLYALGVLLYQLVTADLRHPLAPGWEQEIDDALLREDIREAANLIPTKRLSSAQQLADRLRALPARRLARHEDEERAARIAIAERALERNRARRPWLIAAVSALTLGLAASLWFFHQATTSRDEALRQAAIVQAASDVLNDDLAAAANPDLGGTSGATVLAALTAAAASIDERLRAAPEIALRLHQTIGIAYRTLGRYGEAEAEFRRAWTLAQGRAINRDAMVGAALLLAQDLAYQSKYDEARSLLDRADATLADERVASPAVEVQRWDVHAMLDRHRGDLAAALHDSAKALTALRSSQTDGQPLDTQLERLSTLHIALAQQEGGERALAERLERELLARLEHKGLGSGGFALRVRQQLLDNLIAGGRLDEASQLLPSLQAITHERLGDSTPTALNLRLSEARLESARGHHALAIAAARRAAEGYATLFGANNDVTIRCLLTLGQIERASGAPAEALADLRRAAIAAESLQGSRGPLAQLAAYEVAAALQASGDSAAARAAGRLLDAKLLAAAAPGRDWPGLLHRLHN